MKLLTCLLVLGAGYVSANSLNITEPISPQFDAYRDIRLLLITRDNVNNPVQLRFRDLTALRNSPFKAGNPLRVLIHGWFEDDTSDATIDIARELLSVREFNVIFVDWSGSRSINYVETRRRVPIVANFIASYVDFLHENFLSNFKTTSIVGFSIGAHIAGHVGKFVRRGKINTIVGLDPNSGLFSVNTPGERLDAGDAEYVEAVHTNGGFGNFGIGAPIAHADFFPNGGSSQPGCITNTCSHIRAVNYYIESIRQNGFHGFRCATANDAGRGRCTGSPGGWLGGEPSNFNKALRGIFWLETNRREPFAMGPRKP